MLASSRVSYVKPYTQRFLTWWRPKKVLWFRYKSWKTACDHEKWIIGNCAHWPNFIYFMTIIIRSCKTYYNKTYIPTYNCNPLMNFNANALVLLIGRKSIPTISQTSFSISSYYPIFLTNHGSYSDSRHYSFKIFLA